MRRSDKSLSITNQNGVTITIKGRLPLALDADEAAMYRAMQRGVKCRGFTLYCAVDSPDKNAPGFTLSHNVHLEEVAGAILQDSHLGAAALWLAKNGMLMTDMTDIEQGGQLKQ